MFKRLTTLFLLAALIGSNCSMFLVYAGFAMNQKYIAENLCINRNKPWLHCNGKCYFMRKIKEAQDNEKKQSSKDNSMRLEVSFFQEPYKMIFIEPVILESDKSTFPQYTYQYSSSYINTIFRPPKGIA